MNPVTGGVRTPRVVGTHSRLGRGRADCAVDGLMPMESSRRRQELDEAVKDLELRADLRNASGEIRHRRGDQRDDDADDERGAGRHQGRRQEPRNLPLLERARSRRQHDADDKCGDDRNERLAGEIERGEAADDGEDRKRPGGHQLRPVRLFRLVVFVGRLNRP